MIKMLDDTYRNVNQLNREYKTSPTPTQETSGKRRANPD